ncbi:hypothetical protein [Marinobacter shengliensis]|uniref:hypothetical protein n=1 Tax=Marinobacter shengliensis TaxID=1389223 RepID=UPI001E6250FA|nr:hypothetical protein [Marinobacter shengliensis]MCD1628285.1 hypothetical protein [Marinobacter shengliensis]
MPRACVTKTHNLAALMRLSDLELRVEIQAAAAADPLQALHLCHELLAAQQYYPTRRGLSALVGREVERIGQQLTHKPEIAQ